MELVFLGPPGAGKGTQAQVFAAAQGVPHISTGDIFRTHVGQGTELGRRAKAYMERGDLVPDDVVCGMVAERLREPDAAEGFILDGFPRTVPQAEALERNLEATGRSLTGVISFELPDATVIDRLGGRMSCDRCGALHHRVFSPPARAGVCDACGGELTVRADDRPEAIARRLDEYRTKTSPLTAWYRERGLLRVLDASGSIESVQAALAAVAGGR